MSTPSSWGRELSSKIVKTCELYAQHPAPCEFKLLEKEVGDNKVEAWLTAEEGTLCGRDYANEIFVFDGNVVSSPAMGSTPLQKQVVSRGRRTGISFVKAFADYASFLVESDPAKPQRIELSSASDPSDANIVVPELVRRFIESKGKALDVSGDVSIAVESRVKRLWTHEQPR